MDLYSYRGKRVKIKSIGGKRIEGYAAYYTSELDDPNGIASLSIEVDGEDDVLFNFSADEIASIEIVGAATPLAQAV